MNNNELKYKVTRRLWEYKEQYIVGNLLASAFPIATGISLYSTGESPLLLVGSLVPLAMTNYSIHNNHHDRKYEITALKLLKAELKAGINRFEDANYEDFNIELAKLEKELKGKNKAK